VRRGNIPGLHHGVSKVFVSSASSKTIRDSLGDDCMIRLSFSVSALPDVRFAFE
jgi:hypothetical protein